MILSYIIYQIFLIISNFLCSSCYLSLDYDDSCGSGNSLGVCKNITECPTAHAALVQRKRHGLERCGFNGIVEVVCCPDYKESAKVTEKVEDVWGRFGPSSAVPTPTPTPVTIPPTDVSPKAERKSEAVCLEYAPKIPPGIKYQILGGENASLGEFPHMAQVGFPISEIPDGYSWDCGGALISDRFVLTAAHCTYKTDGTIPVRVRMGLVDMDDTNIVPQEFGILKLHVHDDYNRRSKINDIALIELDNAATMNLNVQPACLYQNDDDPEGLVITGWGYTSTGGEQSTVLQKAVIHAVELNECSKIYEKRVSRAITALQICCVSNDGTKDTCQGDSGGPLQIQIMDGSDIYTIVGVTSFGLGCGGSTPGIYTRVSKYLDWIEGIVWP